MSIFQVIEVIIFKLKIINTESIRKYLYNNPAVARKIFQYMPYREGRVKRVLSTEEKQRLVERLKTAQNSKNNPVSVQKSCTEPTLF